MALLFDRRCELIAGAVVPANFVDPNPNALRITNLRIDFKIEKDDKPGPNRCEIQVYNLSAKSRGQLEKKGVRVLLSAGYAATIAQIFSGDVRFANSEKKGPDWVTKIECGDGERAFNFARISESWASGVAIKDVIASTVKALKLDKGNASDAAGKATAQFVNGYTQHGTASAELTRLLTPMGLSWSVQDGRVEILGADETVNDQVPLFNSDTGLVGSPEYGTGEKLKGPAYLKCRVLLQPRIRPGQKFKLDAATQKGFFKARKVVHTGSTHGGDWYSDIEATKLP